MKDVILKSLKCSFSHLIASACALLAVGLISYIPNAILSSQGIYVKENITFDLLCNIAKIICQIVAVSFIMHKDGYVSAMNKTAFDNKSAIIFYGLSAIIFVLLQIVLGFHILIASSFSFFTEMALNLPIYATVSNYKYVFGNAISGLIYILIANIFVLIFYRKGFFKRIKDRKNL